MNEIVNISVIQSHTDLVTLSYDVVEVLLRNCGAPSDKGYFERNRNCFMLISKTNCFTGFLWGFRPPSGSMLLYSRNKVRYRKDGYSWKKRKDGKTIREDHMKLKVQGVEVSVMLPFVEDTKPESITHMRSNESIGRYSRNLYCFRVKNSFSLIVFFLRKV